MSAGRDFKYIVRIAGTDVQGKEKVPYALLKIKGIGYNTAKAICYTLKIDPSKRLGDLQDGEIKKISDFITSKKMTGIPVWAFNMSRDYEEGIGLHLILTAHILNAKRDIEREKKARSWRGIRHSLGLKVRGQRTRTTGRTGSTVGVSRRKVAQPQGGASQQGGK